MKVLVSDGKKIDFDGSVRLGKDGEPVEWDRKMSVVGWAKPDPDEEYTVAFSEVSDGLVGAFEFAYKMERQNEGKDIPYEGPDITANALSDGLGMEFALSADNLEYDGALRTLVSCAMRLGMEQAYRIVLDKASSTCHYAQDIRNDLDNPDPEIRANLLRKLDRLDRKAHDPGSVLPALWGREEDLTDGP